MASVREQHLNRLKVAEHQFRLACAVNHAVFNGVQPLDVPVEWAFGQHSVSYEDFGLRLDQAEDAAAQLRYTATFVLVSIVRDAIVALFENPKMHPNEDVVSTYQITRIMRNAFSHSMLYPKWSIDEDCTNRVFSIDGVLSLNTTGLHGKPLQWRDYGGPLALFALGRFVRTNLLGDEIDPMREKPPFPSIECYQQGSLVLRRVPRDEEPVPGSTTSI